MRQRNLRRLPVVDAAGRLVGLVSRVDLLRAVAPGPADVQPEEPRLGHVEATAPVRTIMSTAVPVVGPDARLAEVINVVLSNRMRRAVVVDERNHVLGIIRDLELTDRLTPEERPGLLSALAHRLPIGRGNAAEKEPVKHQITGNRARDLMLTDIVVAREDESIRDVLTAMMAKDRTIAPVVDQTDELVGIVYRTDVLDALVEA
jgi:CBS domain-containing protein